MVKQFLFIMTCLLLILGCVKEVNNEATDETTRRSVDMAHVSSPFRQRDKVQQRCVRDRLIVKIKDDQEDEFFAMIAEEYPGSSVKRLFNGLKDGLLQENAERYGIDDIYVVEFPEDIDNSMDMIRRFSQEESVLYAEPDYRVTLYDTFSLTLPLRIGETLVSSTTSPVVVAVMDTGVDYNDLSGYMWVNEAEDLNGNGILDPDDLDGIDNDVNGWIDDVHGYDFADDDPNPMDIGDHGTKVASNVVKIAPNCKIMALKVFSTASGENNSSAVFAGWIYAADNGADVINMSWGFGAFSQTAYDIIRFLHDSNIILVAATGNNGWNIDFAPSFPASFSEVIAVSGVDEQDPDHFCGANYGNKLDVVAPTSADMYGVSTSFASPKVAGLVALLIEEFRARGISYSSEQIRKIIRASSMDIIDTFSTPGFDMFTGYGRANKNRALQMIQNDWIPGVSININTPSSHSTLLRGDVQIEGCITCTSYTVEVASWEDPSNFTLIYQSPETTDLVTYSGLLASFNTQELSLPDGRIIIRITAYDKIYFSDREFFEGKSNYAERILVEINISGPSGIIFPIKPRKKWTFILYTDADEKKSVYVARLVSYTLGRIASHLDDVLLNDANFIAQIDWGGCDIDNYLPYGASKRFELHPIQTFDFAGFPHKTYPQDVSELSACMLLNEPNMGDPQTLFEFVKWAMDLYPAQAYCLILIDHGRGWRGTCWDKWNDLDYLTPQEIKEALSQIRNYLGKPIDILAFEACLMANFDAIYEYKNMCNWIVAAETTINSSYDLPFEAVVEQLKANPSSTPEDLARTFVDKFDPGLCFTVSAVKSSELTELEEAINNLGQKLRHVISTYRDKITASYEPIRAPVSFYPTIPLWYVDLFTFANNLKNNISDPEIQDASQRVIDNISLAVPYVKTAPVYVSNYKGISIEFNLEGEESEPSDYDPRYDDLLVARELNWDSFLKAYFDELSDSPNMEPVCDIISVDVNFPYITIKIQANDHAHDPVSNPFASVTRVEVKMDNEEWITATSTGSDTWEVTINVTDLPYHMRYKTHMVYARAFDGQDYSGFVSTTVTVEAPLFKRPEGGGGGSMCFIR
jgi:hypothetical protein